jgi:hypothetical protein
MCSAARLITGRAGRPGAQGIWTPRVRTRWEHKPDHARPLAGYVPLSDPGGLRGFRGRGDPVCPRFPSWNLDGEGVDGSSP